MNLLCFLVDFLFEFVDIDAFFGGDEHHVVAHSVHPCLFQLVERYVLARGRGEVVGVLGGETECVDFVEHHYHGLVGTLAHVGERAVHHFYLLFKVGM